MKVIAKNKRARYDYYIERTLTAGIVLDGAEAKSVRSGLVSLKGSFAHIKNGELWLFNVHITRYPFAASAKEPTRTRKLLVNKRELQKLNVERKAGRSVVPLAILAGRFIKIELGVGKSKKKYDKRQTIKARDTKRHVERTMSAK